MPSAKPLCDSRTPSMLRNTSVSWLDAAAALATTKATVALSVLSLAQVRLTQNFPVPATLESPFDCVEMNLSMCCAECSTSWRRRHDLPKYSSSCDTTRAD